MSVAPCEAWWKHSIVDIVMLLRGWTRIVFGPAPVSTIPVLATGISRFPYSCLGQEYTDIICEFLAVDLIRSIVLLFC